MMSVLTKIHDTLKCLKRRNVRTSMLKNVAATLHASNILRLLPFFGHIPLFFPCQPEHHPTSSGSRPGDTMENIHCWPPQCQRLRMSDFLGGIVFFVGGSTLPKTNIAPKNRPSQKETIVFQPSSFGGYVTVSFREGISPNHPIFPADRSTSETIAPWPHRPRSWLQFSQPNRG